MKYALLSVFDKTGIVEFASQLLKLNYEIISTGGTAKELTANNIKVIPIQEITGNPESFDGRMKTISFQVESGILYDRTNLSHIEQAKELKIKPIDIVVCNLYPFEENPTIENIDVGGPTMIRAAAKNFKNVLVLTNPSDYKLAIDILSRHSGERSDSRIHSISSGQVDSGQALRLGSGQARMTFDEFKKSLAAKAFFHLSFYDSQIAKFLNKERFPQEYTIPGRKALDLRYGENPHQNAALYLEPNTDSPLKNLTKIAGRELSLVNVADINAGLESVKLFRQPCAVIIKHNNPCGIALGNSIDQALKRAIEGDPESAFGGIAVLNKPVDKKTAAIIKRMDIIAAPNFEKSAVELLIKTRKSMGIYSFGKTMNYELQTMNLKPVNGGFIVQTPDAEIDKSFKQWKIVTRKKPTKKQIEQMQIAWKFISRIRSNAVIVVDKDLPMTRGIGSGQTSRLRSTKLALEQAGKFAKGAIMASDSFFPFADSVKLAANNGISAIVQQGGSINDKASIDAANAAGIAMVFTNRRAFWH